MNKIRKKYIRRQAVDTLELTKGITGKRDNTLKTMEELAGYILELTNE